jgi:hypothetical protein
VLADSLDEYLKSTQSRREWKNVGEVTT